MAPNVDALPPARPATYSPLWQIMLSRLRTFHRQPEAVFWTYGFPLLLAIALSFAFRSRPVERVTVDVEAGPAAGPALAVLAADPRLKATVQEAGAARRRLHTTKTDLVVVPRPPGYEYLFDPNRPESVLARAAADSALLRAGPAKDAVPVRDTPSDDAGGRYIDFLIPGLLGMNLMGGGLWGVGFVIVDMRVRKLLKRFLATPMRKDQFLLGTMLSRMAFTLVEIAVLVAFGYFAFGVAVRGSLAALAAVVAAGGLAFAGIGLLVACRAQTTEAVSGLMNLVMLPMYVFSGVFFSSERFPDAFQPVIKALPLTALNDALRGVMNDGESLAAQGPRLATLAAWGGVSFVLALKWFRWR